MDLLCPHCNGLLVDQPAVVVEALLKQFSRSKDYTDWGHYRNPEVNESYDVPGLGVVYVVESIGGYEDGPSTLSLVFRAGDCYFRKTGSYDSYDGSDWDGPFEMVEPETRTVTAYRTVRQSV